MALTCKCPQCDQDVEYEPIRVSGMMFTVRVNDPLNMTKTIYLTCPNGHRNPYLLKNGKLTYGSST
jgi:hypothetical protein